MTEDQLLERWLALGQLQDPEKYKSPPKYGYDVAGRGKQIIFFGKIADPKELTAEERDWYADQNKNVNRQVRPQWALVVVTLGAVAAAVITFCVLNASLKEARRTTRYARQQAQAASDAAGTAQQEFELSERPWVSASNFKITKPLEFMGDAAIINISADLNNHGHSVATQVNFRVHLVGETSEIKTQEQTVCQPLRAMPEQGSHDVVFPGEPVSKIGGDLMKHDEIAKGMEIWKKLNPRSELIIPLMIVCIDYQFPFGTSHHQTRYAFRLGVPWGGALSALRPQGKPKGVVLSPADVSAD